GCPLERCVEIGHVDQAEPAELLLRIGVRSVLHVSSASIHAYRRSSMGPLERRAAAHYAGIGQRLAVGPPAGPVMSLPLIVTAGGKISIILVDQDGVLHDSPHSVASALRSFW